VGLPRGCAVRPVDAPPDDGEGGVYYETSLPDGRLASGVAPDVEQAKALVQAAESGAVYSCDYCARAVNFDADRGAWKHMYPDPGADPVPCSPGNPSSTRAFPAPPKSRDRKFARGVWPG
jgi:hypothetical protein